MTEPAKPGDFLSGLAGRVWTSIPVLSALTFVLVAVKVFRASYMETSTTVAIVSSADQVALLKGVVLTLLPGFLAAVIVAAIWWWAGTLPDGKTPADARKTLVSPGHGLMWALLIVGFFTISWPIFIAILLPVLVSTGWLIVRSVDKHANWEWDGRLRRSLRTVGILAATGSLLYLALSPTVWLPLREITVQPTQTIVVKDGVLPTHFAAYVLSSDDKGADLLLDSPRAVIHVRNTQIEDNPQICIPPTSSLRWLFLRTSQAIHLDADRGSPYPTCPERTE
jgi:hypothetical protein